MSEFIFHTVKYYDALMHHGIRGQKWGVRNGPPYPIEDKVLRKGTRLNHVTPKYLKTSDLLKSTKNRPLYTYRDDEKWDNKVYKGPFTYGLAMKGARFVAEHKMITTEDMRMPTRKERRDAFTNMLGEQKTLSGKIKRMEAKNFLKTCQNNEKYYKSRGIKTTTSDEILNMNMNKIVTEKDKDNAYFLFNKYMSYAYKNPAVKNYMKEMEKNYDAMVDDNNQKVYNDAHDPIIVFKGYKYLEPYTNGGNSSVSLVTTKEIGENLAAVDKEMKKQGRRVAL